VKRSCHYFYFTQPRFLKLLKLQTMATIDF